VTFRELSAVDAESIASWRYAAAYSTYDVPEAATQAAVSYMADPKNQFFAALESDDLVAFCSIGRDGQVPGGDYNDSATDIGFGMRPDLVGHGKGAVFIREVAEFVEARTGGGPLRVTIAAWNGRALRAATAAGFAAQGTFVDSEGRQFTVLVRG
jgi:[ribosomal protein S18]-alanine N-acetyltransferase